MFLRVASRQRRLFRDTVCPVYLEPSIAGGPFLYTYAKFRFESSELETKHKTDGGAVSERAESSMPVLVFPGPQ